MASGVTNELTQMQNYTNQQKANTISTKTDGAISSDAFLQLLTMQLQYQDPMNPMDNSQMLAQEAQFVTLEQMEKLTSSFTQFSSIYQANALIGKAVEVKDSDGNYTTGIVDYIDYTDKNGASVSIEGVLHPLDSITKVYPDDNVVTEEKAWFYQMFNFVGSVLGAIAEKMGIDLNPEGGEGSEPEQGGTEPAEPAPEQTTKA